MRNKSSSESPNCGCRFFAALFICLAGVLQATAGSVGGPSTSAPAASADALIPAMRTELWANSYGARQYGLGMNVTKPLAMAVSANTGRVFETAAVVGADGYRHYATAAYDTQTGAVVWTAFFGSPVAGDADPYAIAVSADGSKVFVTGSDNFFGANGSDLGTVAYDAATGAQLWSNTLNVGGYDSGLAIGVSADGSRVYVCGGSYTGPGANYGFLTVGYNASSGQRLWQQRYIGPAKFSDTAIAMAVDHATDRIFITGYSANATPTNDFAVVAYAGGTGQNLWVTRWAGRGGNAESHPHAIAISPDGARVFVTGYSNEDSNGEWFDCVTVAFDAVTGSKTWEGHYKGNIVGYPQGTDVAVSPDGTKVFVAGRAPGPLTPVPCINSFCDTHQLAIAYDVVTGAELWSATYGLNYVYSTGSVAQGATGVGVSPDAATVYITGVGYNGGVDFVADTMALDASTGAQKWEGRFTPIETGDDSAIATRLAVEPRTGKVLVAALFEHTDPTALGPYLTYGAIAYVGDGLVAAVSRKTHGADPSFDIQLPITGAAGIECRSEGPAARHHIVFSFANAVTVGNATVTPSGSGTTAEIDGPPVRSADGKEITVNLKNVSNAQTVNITLLGVSDGTNTNDVSVQMNVLAGDTNGDGVVNSADIAQTKSQSGQTVTAANFREDVTVDGNVNSADIAVVKSKSGTGLPGNP